MILHKAKAAKRMFNGFFVEFLKLIIQSLCNLISVHQKHKFISALEDF